MRKILSTLTLFIFLIGAKAQQLHFMSQYLLYNPMYNPGAAGFSENPVVGISYRSMWSAFPGNPKTYMVYGDTKWEKMNCGISGYVYRDETGPTSRTGIQAAYSYHVKTGANSQLGLGIELRGLQYAIDKGKLIDALGSDLVLSGNNTQFKLDAGAGIYYKNRKLSAGIAVSQLIQSKLAFGDVVNATERGQLVRHYVLIASYIIQTGENTQLIPNTMVRYITNAPTELDLGFKIDFKDKIWWALNWRLRQYWSIQAGFKILDKVGLSYSYDYYASPFSDYNTGNNAHEIGLRFEMPGKKTKK